MKITLPPSHEGIVGKIVQGQSFKNKNKNKNKLLYYLQKCMFMNVDMPMTQALYTRHKTDSLLYLYVGFRG